MEVIPHIFGFIGLIFIVLAWQFDNRNTILWLHVSAFVVFAIELFFLDAIVGAIMMLAAALKATAAVFTQKRWVIVTFIIVPLIFSIFQYENWYDILTMVAHVTGALTFFSKKIENMRILAPFGTILWAIHNFVVGAWGQLIADFFILGSMSIGGFRHYRKKMQAEETS